MASGQLLRTEQKSKKSTFHHQLKSEFINNSDLTMATKALLSQYTAPCQRKEFSGTYHVVTVAMSKPLFVIRLCPGDPFSTGKVVMWQVVRNE